MTALDGSVNYPIRDCIFLAGNPLIKLRPSRLFSIHMSKPVASRFGQMESKTESLKISLRNRVYHLHKLVSCTGNCRENETKQNKALH